ncbi:MAG: PD-(D/E)XK nuclease family protein, partial [Clostridia bacterium]
RARDRLILVGTHANRAQAILTWQVSCLTPMRPESFLDMVMPAMYALAQDDPGCGQPDAERMGQDAGSGDAAVRTETDAERMGQDAEPWLEDAAGSGDAAVRTEIFWHGERAPVFSVPKCVETKPDAQSVLRMREALSWRYPFEGEAFQPVKLTASGLTREVTGARAVPGIERRPKFLSEKKLTGAEKGTQTHAVLSLVDLAKLRGLSGAALDAEISRQIAALVARGVLALPTPAPPIAAFFGRAMVKRLLAAKRVEREWPFNLRMTVKEALGGESEAEIVVQGVVDCCFEEDGGWVLLEYKTDREEDEAALLARYRAQVQLYRSALERITGRPVTQAALCLLTAARELTL